ncbi:MAG: TatD family hydrolase [Barnesiella sp.]|nr:TatD family hydrolase [Barnesiella sp.]MBD5248829.1 TatD family hydrolase [Barnesiella sp.]
MFIDTHTHLYLPEFAPDPAAAVDRAVDAGVGFMIFPNVDLSTVEPMKLLHSRRPEVTAMAMGLHPTEVNSDYRQALNQIEAELLADPTQYVAVGEIGIDLYWDKTFREEQMEVFRTQCRWAVDMDKPVIIHCREGLDETLEVLASLPEPPRGVFHSFGGTPEDVERIRRTGDFYFGINGIVTFKNSSLRNTIKHIDPERLLLETDAPYLAPVPMRGKRNESAFMIHTAAHVADSLGMTHQRLASLTTENAKRLFRL